MAHWCTPQVGWKLQSGKRSVSTSVINIAGNPYLFHQKYVAAEYWS